MGLGRLFPDAKKEQKFRQLVHVYAEMVCGDEIETFAQPQLEEILRDMAESEGFDFTTLLTEEKKSCMQSVEIVAPPATAVGVLSLEDYARVVRAGHIAFKIQEIEEKIADNKRLIENTRITGPFTFETSAEDKKNYKEIKESERKELQDENAELRKQLTRFKNNELLAEEQAWINEITMKWFKIDGGIPTAEAVEARIAELTQIALEAGIYEFYPTPTDIIQEFMIGPAELKPGMSVLEPSAGTGNIAAVILESEPGVQLDVIEYNETLREILVLKGYQVVGTDTMLYSGKRYDRIIMNPPFDMGVDIEHVEHCYNNLLQPGGKLISVMSKRAYTDSNSFKSVKFKRLVDKVGKATMITNERYTQNIERAITIDVIIVEMTKPLFEEKIIENFLTPSVNDILLKKSSRAKYKVESIQDGIYVLRNQATQNVEREDGISDARWEILVNGVVERKALPTRKGKRDATFSTPSIITARAELTKLPKGRHVDPSLITSFVKDYVVTGADYAIEALERTGGFALADGTGTGKTIQQLFVAHYFLKKYNKPVLIFTESDSIIQQSFFGDARKLGMVTPDARENKLKVAHRPKNYSGLYDDENLINVHRFNPHTGLKPGINVGTYNDLSLLMQNHPLLDAVKDARRIKGDADREFAQRRAQIKDRKMKKHEAKEAREKLRAEQDSDPRYSAVIRAEDDWFNEQAALLAPIAKESAVLIYDECHNLKNTKGNTIRAERGMILSDNAQRVMFVSATFADKAGDIFYLKRAGIYKDEEGFARLMAGIGFFWNKPKFNKRGEMIRRGEWKSPALYPEEAAIRGMDAIFARLTEDGCMLKREIELKNLKKNAMIDVEVPDYVQGILENIRETLEKDAADEEKGSPEALILMEQKWALEPFKIDETVRLTEEAIEDGQNVVIFCELKEEGAEAKAWGEKKAGTIRVLKDRLSELYGEENIGIVVGVGSEWEKQQRFENIKKFQEGGKRIIIATISSGGTGISLDDTVGDAPRRMIIMTAPMNSIKVVQALGRVVRANTKSSAEAYFLFADADVDQWLKNLLASKLSMLGAVVEGQVSLLQPAEVEMIDTAGDAGAVAAFKESKGDTVVKHHSMFNAKREIDGTTLPAGKPFLLRKRGSYEQRDGKWGMYYYVHFRGKNKQAITRWEKEYADLIQKYGFKKESSSYEGTFFECIYTDEIWEILLNQLAFENLVYKVEPRQIFNVGQSVVATEDIRQAEAARGMHGQIMQIRPRKGYYLYQVLFSNGNIAETIEAQQIAHGEDFAEIEQNTGEAEYQDVEEYEEELADGDDDDAVSLSDELAASIYAMKSTPSADKFLKVLGIYTDMVQSGEILQEAIPEMNAMLMELGVLAGIENVHEYGIFRKDFIKRGRDSIKKGWRPDSCPPRSVNGEPCITPACIAEVERCIHNNPQTKDLHTVHGKYTASRQALHRGIIAQVQEQAPCVTHERPIAILTGGAPGSGKSAILKKFPWLKSGGLYHIDADEVRAKLPEYKGWNASNTHMETKDIVSSMLETIGTPCTHDMIYDGTMNSVKSYKPLIAKMRSLGYRIFVIYVRVPQDVSKERVLSRYKKTGRYVPIEVIEDFYGKGETAFREILKSTDGYVIYDGVTGKLIEKGGEAFPKDRNYSLFGESKEKEVDCCAGMADGNLILGKKTTVETPQRSIAAQYALAELSELITSHDPVSFSPDKRYPANCQQRDYQGDKAEQMKVERGASTFDARFLLNNAPTATDGPAIVNRTLGVLGGNGRTMMMNRVENYAEKYVQPLIEQRCLFGFSKDDIARFKKPVLIRLVDMAGTECAVFSNILNQNLTQDQDITTKTVSYARQITPKALEEIATVLEGSGANTFAEALQDAIVVKHVFKTLRQVGIITDENVSKWMSDTATFTKEGRLLLEGTLLGAVLPDKQLIEAARNYTDKILKVLPLFLRMQSLPAKWNIIPDIQDVLKLESERRASGATMEMFLKQVSFDRDSIQEKTELIWKSLNGPMSDWKYFIQRFLKTAEREAEMELTGGGFAFSEAVTPEELIKKIRQDLANGKTALNDDEQPPELTDTNAGQSEPTLADKITEVRKGMRAHVATFKKPAAKKKKGFFARLFKN